MSLDNAIVNEYKNDTGHFISRLGVVLTRAHQAAHFICNVVQPGLEDYYNRTISQLLTKANCEYYSLFCKPVCSLLLVSYH